MSTSSVVNNQTLKLLRAHLGMPQLEVMLKEEWSSEAPNYRSKIRESLVAELEKRVTVTAAMKEELLDLMRIPSHPQVGISISHNKKCGGFALNPDGGAMGLDVELVERVKHSVVARASTYEEFANAPSTASLWTAKEAALKSFLGAARAPEVLSQVEIGDWELGNDDGVELCRVLGMADGPRGCVVELGDMKVAVFRRGGLNAMVTD